MIRRRTMFLRHRPSDSEIRRFIAEQSPLPFSYPEVGATATQPPVGATVDHNRVRLGSGEAVFHRAVAALRGWCMFAIDGVQLCWPTVPIEVGTTVAILAGERGMWSLNACRVVYVIDETGPVTRCGFAYGTL